MRHTTKRIDIRMPETILKEIDEYQLQKNITSRTAAMLELIRISLDNLKSVKKAGN